MSDMDERRRRHLQIKADREGLPPQKEPHMSKSEHFAFDGGAATYVGTFLLAFLVTVCTLGIAYPWALCMKQRWIAKHTIVDGHRCRFTAGGMNLFGHWIKWWFLCLITIGIYSFWVGPRLQKWIVEHTDY
jgi:uncharacterized membrane protein YjgN (DUF898 family)